MAECKEEGCSVLTTGKCINGLEIDVCPHYSDQYENNVDLEESNTDNDPDFNGEDAVDDIAPDKNHSEIRYKEIHRGTALSFDDANKFAKSTQTRLVILAGMPNAGKTTSILSLLHLFAIKPSFAKLIFAGSKTLLDFEEKSHLSKIDSERIEPETARTLSGASNFMHLKVAMKDDVNKSTDLIFTDISGETFDSLKNSTQECRNFILGNRADHFVLFLDSQMLSTMSKRAATKADGIGILNSLIDAGTLSPHTHIQIVFSKWDLFETTKNKDNHEQFLENIINEINTKHSTKYNIAFVKLISRPKKGDFEFGHGLEDLVKLWVSHSAFSTNQSLKLDKSKISNSRRQFSRFEFNNK